MGSQLCHRCGPHPQECPTVLCAPCALQLEASEQARKRLEALIPLADAVRDLLEFKPFKPAIYIPPLGHFRR